MITSATSNVFDFVQEKSSEQVDKIESEALLESCLYQGIVHHRRLTPVRHEFRYPLSLFCVNLDEIEDVFRIPRLISTNRWSWIQFRRSDYHGPSHRPLADCVRDTVRVRTGLNVIGPIRMLTNPRYLGIVCNPVTFYYCYNSSGSQLEAVLSEVTNTPWGERYSYVIPWQASNEVLKHECKKEMHVSPFMPMEMAYHWQMTLPRESLKICISNYATNDKAFSASLSLQRRDLTTLSALKASLSFPWMTARIFLAIYWQAFKLWRKRVPFHTHPNKLSKSDN